MSAYPHYVQLAWDVTSQLLRDWQQMPVRWAREIDIQAELHGRLSAVFQLTGRSIVIDNASRSIARIAAEPTVYYQGESASELRCIPDIIIRDDAANNPPTDGSFFHWPLSWVCELKYDPYDGTDWTQVDLNKLRLLIAQNKTKYGCCVRLSRKPAESGDGITWQRDDQQERLWICEARLLPIVSNVVPTQVKSPFASSVQ